MAPETMFDVNRNSGLENLKNKIGTTIVVATLLALSQVAFSESSSYRTLKGAEIYSTQLFKYGRFSAKIRAAQGEGVLSTLFMYKEGSQIAGVDWEEIDIEIFGKDAGLKWQSNVITGAKAQQHDEVIHCFEDMPADGFNTFTLEWTPTSISWYVNEKLIRTATGRQVEKLTTPQSLRSNIWASSVTSWVGTFRKSILPLAMAIDWVEVHTWNAGEFSFLWRDDFDSFNSQRWSKANWSFEQNLVQFDPANVFVQDGLLILGITDKHNTRLSLNEVAAQAYSLPRNEASAAIPCDTNSSVVPKVRLEDLFDASS